MDPLMTGKTPSGAAPAAFVPAGSAQDVAAAPRHGKRRKIAPRACIPLLWPTEMKPRKELFDAWHQIAMQVLHEERQSFRLVAVIERFINWQSGELWPTNETLARRAGGCDESTIKREVGAYQRLGLLVVDLGCRRQKGGRLVRKRTIGLAIPVGFAGHIDGIVEGGHRGPDGEVHQGGHRGPGQGGHRGPDTFEDTLEGAKEANDAA